MKKTVIDQTPKMKIIDIPTCCHNFGRIYRAVMESKLRNRKLNSSGTIHGRPEYADYQKPEPVIVTSLKKLIN